MLLNELAEKRIDFCLIKLTCKVCFECVVIHLVSSYPGYLMMALL